MEQQPLTSRQKEILDYLESFTMDFGYPPTVREICSATGLKSPRSASQHLQALERKGYIERGREKSRAIRFLHRPVADDAGVVRLPVRGSVTAGEPKASSHVTENPFGIDRRLVGGEECFLLRVEGTSMTDAHIVEGDYVVVDPVADTSSGEVVVAEIDGETTVKRYVSRQGRDLLVPEDSEVASIDISSKRPNVRILGKMVGLIRRMS